MPPLMRKYCLRGHRSLQILDNTATQIRKLTSPINTTDQCMALYQQNEGYLRPVGEWN